MGERDQEIRERLEAMEEAGHVGVTIDPYDEVDHAYYEPTITFIAHAPEDIDYLLARLAAYEELEEAAREALDDHDEYGNVNDVLIDALRTALARLDREDGDD